jgi:dihydrodipicolinate synthase/N-acetylneuraminate lyase
MIPSYLQKNITEGTTMKLGGVLPPITIPFQDGKLALDKLKKNFQKWNKTGLSAFLILGSNGESVYLSENEKIRVVEISRESIPKSKIMMVRRGNACRFKIFLTKGKWMRPEHYKTN